MIKEKSINEWQEIGWNPVTGCSKCSAGCKNCYAVDQAEWLHGMNNVRYKNNFDITLHDDVIEEFYEKHKNKKKTYLVFVNSMSDLLHEKVPTDFILKCFDVMNRLPKQRFLVLTKRSSRLKEINDKVVWSDNIMMGVSVENTETLFRMEDLKNCNAAFKMVSMGPLVDEIKTFDPRGIDWVAVEGESIGGRSKSKGCVARYMEASWVRQIRDVCIKNTVNFTFKQWGGYDRKFNGSVLDGKVWDDRPSDVFHNHPSTWVKKLIDSPALASECDIFEKFLIGDWIKLLKSQMNLANYAKNYPSGYAALLYLGQTLEIDNEESIFDNMSTASSLILAGERPELLEKLKERKNFNIIDWQWLLAKHSDLKEEALKTPSGFAACLIEDNSLEELGKKHWAKISINAWMPLLIKSPKLLEKCPTEKRKYLDWNLLEKYHKGISNKNSV